MTQPTIEYCPGTLAENNNTYSKTALRRLFNGKKVSPILPYPAPYEDEDADEAFEKNRERLSISGVQEKFSVLLEKNQLRLIRHGEAGQYILKPAPRMGKNPDQMPANEHLTMQIARQVFKIETAENAMVFFKNGAPAYLTKRFDWRTDDKKWAQEDFASLAELTPQTHGENYKYAGNYLELFKLMQKYVPAYKVEAPKLFRLVLFNYLISNGDAHFKNFSLIETSFGDFRLSPAYDLLNSRMHIADRDFALDQGLLPPQFAQGKIKEQFVILGQMAGIPQKQLDKIMADLTGNINEVKGLIHRSYLAHRFKRNYEQAYLTRVHKLTRT